VYVPAIVKSRYCGGPVTVTVLFRKIIRTPYVHEQEYEVLWLFVETKRDPRAKTFLGTLV